MVESQKIPGVDLRSSTEPQVLRILVKAPCQKEEFLVPQGLLVREFKEHVSRHFSSSPDRVVLVYGGRILKDHKTLSQYRIHTDDDATIHVVIRSHRAPQPGHTSIVLTPPTPEQNPLPSRSLASDGLRELTANLGLNTASFREFQSQLMSRPDLMLQLLENPSVQSKLSSPGLLKELLTDNPHVQQVIQAVPEISQVFHSPEGMKLVVELARNPAAVREIIRPPAQASSFPSGDHHASLQGPFLQLLQRGLGKRQLPGSTGGHPAPHPWEKMPTKEWSLPLHDRPSRHVAHHVATGSSDPGRGESGAEKEEAGQVVSTTVRSLLYEIIQHLLESVARGPSRSTAGQGLSKSLELAAKVIRKNAAPLVPRRVREKAVLRPPATALLPLQAQNTDVFWANWTPTEVQGLLEIQQRLQALAADELAKEADRAERPVRRARSNIFLGGLAPPGPQAGLLGFSTQQIWQALVATDWAAGGAKPLSGLRGSSAQPSSK